MCRKVAERLVDDAPRRARRGRPVREIGGGEPRGASARSLSCSENLGLAERADVGMARQDLLDQRGARSAAWPNTKIGASVGSPPPGAASGPRRGLREPAPIGVRGAKRPAQPRARLSRRESARAIAGVVVGLGERVEQEQPLRHVERRPSAASASIAARCAGATGPSIASPKWARAKPGSQAAPSRGRRARRLAGRPRRAARRRRPAPARPPRRAPAPRRGRPAPPPRPPAPAAPAQRAA